MPIRKGVLCCALMAMLALATGCDEVEMTLVCPDGWCSPNAFVVVNEEVGNVQFLEDENEEDRGETLLWRWRIEPDKRLCTSGLYIDAWRSGRLTEAEHRGIEIRLDGVLTEPVIRFRGPHPRRWLAPELFPFCAVL